jgi:hypothetical protein
MDLMIALGLLWVVKMSQICSESYRTRTDISSQRGLVRIKKWYRELIDNYDYYHVQKEEEQFTDPYGMFVYAIGLRLRYQISLY